MDYLIAGLGIGAVLAIIGFLLRELGLSHRRSFPRWMPDTGAALMVAALIIWVVTAAAFFLGMDDDAALNVVLGSVAVAGLSSVVTAAFLTRSRRQAATSAVVYEAEQVAEPASPEVVAGEAESEPLAEPTPADSAAADEESAFEPAAEKNWEEIWRQTWGSDAVRKLAPEAAIEEPATESPAPVDEAVLETWEAPEETGPASTEEQRSETSPEAEGEESGTADPGNDGAEPPAAESEAHPESGDTDNDHVDANSQAPADSDNNEAMYGEPSPNGSDPGSDAELPAIESDTSNTPNHQPT